MQLQFLKTRIAPTPSGFLHIGNVVSFAITAALAARSGACIMLRIDDMDRERTDPAFVQDIFDTLEFLDIPWHEGPRNYDSYKREYSQVHRLPLYNALLTQLWEQDAIFACTCSRSQILAHNREGTYPGTCRHRKLAPDTPGACWRLRTDTASVITVKTLDGPVVMPFPADMTDFVVKRKDGHPAYQLTSITDDQLYGIDLVVRGEDLLHSTLAQLYLASVLGQYPFGQTTFHHHSLVNGSDGVKLSKSAGATSVKYLRQQHTTRDAVYAAISQMLGLPPVGNWQQLAGAYMMPHPHTHE